MSDCPKHPEVPLVSKQVDTRAWVETCPVCEHQEFMALKERVNRLWVRLGMPVDDYLPPLDGLTKTGTWDPKP